MTVGANNSSITKLKDELFSAILLEQQKINRIKGPDSDKLEIHQKVFQDYISYRGSKITLNYLSSGEGHGPFTKLIDGSVKYDLINGIGPNLLGHSHPLMLRSQIDSTCVDTVMVGNLEPYTQSYDLTKTIVDSVKGSRLKHFWFSCSGSFANDVALKILWQKMAPKYGIIAFSKCFSGRSVATQEITANAAYREGMPQYLQVRYVPHFDHLDPDNSTANTLRALDEVWAKEPDTFAAITLEIIQGEGGFIYGPREFYVEIFKWAKSKGLYIWVDEVQTFGRTKKLFAFQSFGLEDYVDVVTVAKALQACGTLYTEELKPKPGLIAGTFNGSIPAILAGNRIIKFLLEGDFYGDNGKIAHIEKQFFKGFDRLENGSCKGRLKYYGGVGLMSCFEVGDSSKEVTEKFMHDLFNNGVIVFTAGKSPTRIRLLVPICLTDEHIEEIMGVFEKTIMETINV